MLTCCLCILKPCLFKNFWSTIFKLGCFSCSTYNCRFTKTYFLTGCLSSRKINWWSNQDNLTYLNRWTSLRIIVRNCKSNRKDSWFLKNVGNILTLARITVTKIPWISCAFVRNWEFSRSKKFYFLTWTYQNFTLFIGKRICVFNNTNYFLTRFKTTYSGFPTCWMCRAITYPMKSQTAWWIIGRYKTWTVRNIKSRKNSKLISLVTVTVIDCKYISIWLSWKWSKIYLNGLTSFFWTNCDCIIFVRTVVLSATRIIKNSRTNFNNTLITNQYFLGNSLNRIQKNKKQVNP